MYRTRHKNVTPETDVQLPQFGVDALWVSCSCLRAVLAHLFYSKPKQQPVFFRQKDESTNPLTRVTFFEHQRPC